MRRFITASLTAIAILSLAVSSVFALGASIRGVSFSLGSLIAKGQVVDLSPYQVTKVELQTSGPADLICIAGDDDHGHHDSYSLASFSSSYNHGDDDHGSKPPVPAPKHPVVSAYGAVWVKANGAGQANFIVEAKPPKYIDAQQAGCPRGYKKALVSFVYFTNATIIDKDKNGAPLARNDYKCQTTQNCVVCKLKHPKHDDD